MIILVSFSAILPYLLFDVLFGKLKIIEIKPMFNIQKQPDCDWYGFDYGTKFRYVRIQEIKWIKMIRKIA